MEPARREVVIDSDDPSDHSEASRAYWDEEVTIQNWIDAGAPDPLAMWEQLQAATDKPTPSTAPRLATPADVRAQGLASIEDACMFFGRISRDTFDRHVRRHVAVKHIGSRPYVVVDSMFAYCKSDAFKSLAA